jgi:hypothetical protein
MEQNKQQELIQALINVQTEIPRLLKNENNPFFKSKYVSLNEILEVAKPVLNKHKLFLTQVLKFEGEKEVIETRIYHVNGEYISAIAPIKIKDNPNDPQKYGSAVTYMRRYSLCPLLGISETEDDDGNNASSNSSTNKKLAKIAEEDQTETFNLANEQLANSLVSQIKDCETLAEIEHLKESKKKEFNKLKKYNRDLYSYVIDEAIMHKQFLVDEEQRIYAPYGEADKGGPLS